MSGWRLILYLLFIFTLPACSAGVSGRNAEDSAFNLPWSYTDLRALDGDDADNTQMDLLAAYLRNLDGFLEFRFDFLELTDKPAFDIYVLIDRQPNSKNSAVDAPIDEYRSDLVIKIPAAGDIQVTRPYSDADPTKHVDSAYIQVYRDPTYDMITISFPQTAFTEIGYAKPAMLLGGSDPRFTFQVLVTPPGSDQVTDRLTPTRSDAPPPDPVPVLFAFLNTYPAYTPASALRRWDGAHTGPWGGRHGLYNLLRTARNAQIPLLLLDLNTPASLSALSFGGYLPFIQEMVSQGLLILPEALPASASLPSPPPPDALDRIHLLNRESAAKFALPGIRTLYSPYGLSAIDEWIELGADIHRQIIFVPESSVLDRADTPPADDLTAAYRWSDSLVIPIPAGDNPDDSNSPAGQATLDGPSLEVRRALIRTAMGMGAETPPILFLGGELPGSTWGIPQAARASFNYLASRPWIKPLNAYDLLSYRAGAQSLPQLPPAISPGSQLQEIITDLLNAPQNAFSNAAVQYLNTLYAAVYPHPPELGQLRMLYLGQIGALISASYWAENPSAMASCTEDVDYDGKAECILASDSIYSIIHPDSSSIAYAFTRTTTGELHQFIAPSSQLITGLSDPTSWRMDRGLAADPEVINGAFGSTNPPSHWSISENELIFSWDNGQFLEKKVALSEAGIQIAILTQAGVSVSAQIPLVVDPWLRFTPDYATRYQVSESENGVTLLVKDGPDLAIASDGMLKTDHFADSRDYLTAPENPNLAYTGGHYLPFPLIIANLQLPAGTRSQVTITVGE